MPKKLFLIDAHSHCYRAYYAIPQLSAPDGRPTNAVLGFTNILFKILREQQPDHIAVAFDSKGPLFRHEQYEKYKANRKAMPDDLSLQIEVIKQIVEACNIPMIAKPGFEADDIIGTLARQGAEKNIDVYIATSDKDALQLLGEHVFRFDASNGAVYSASDLRRDKGIEPEQMIDMLALAGDASDNVPGVEGIGEKTALQLIHEFGTLDNVLANIDKVSGKKRKERLARDTDQARLSRDLVTINTQVDLDIGVDECERQEPDAERLMKIFRELDFKKYVADLSKDTAAAVRKDRNYHLVDTKEKLDAFVRELKGAKEFSFDLETTSARPMQAKIVGFSFSWHDDEAYYLPLLSPAGKVLPEEEVFPTLKPILEDESIGKVGQNLKYDSLVLRNAGVRLNGITFDTMLAAYLLDPGRRRNNIVDLAMDYLGEGKIRTVELLGKGKKQTTMDKVPLDLVCTYACEDADVAWRLTKVLEPMLVEHGLDKLLREVEIPLMRVLEEMEWNGVTIDAPFLEEMSGDLEVKLADLEQRIQDEAGVQFNVASPKQLSKVLFEKFGLTKPKKTTLGYSTSAGVLESLANEHTVPAMVLEYRQLSKLKSTYIDALPKIINKRTGKIHTSFNQTITATGRLSSSNPNLQNIPVRTELGRSIRKAFVPSERNWLMLSADYSQIELRILAHLSEDPALTAAFHEDKDIHAFVASQVYAVDINEVTPEMRRKAKAVNFGIIYGLTPFGLSRGIGVSVAEAGRFIDSYFERYGRVREYIDETVGQARDRGWVVTMLNRRRNIPTINSSNDQERRFGERIAINTVIQGSAADLIKIAMNNILSQLVSGGHSAKILLQIHDELLFEVPETELLFARQLIDREMTGAIKLKVPVKVNIEVGPSWLEAK